jgi:hypothetical protein
VDDGKTSERIGEGQLSVARLTFPVWQRMIFSLPVKLHIIGLCIGGVLGAVLGKRMGAEEIGGWTGVVIGSVLGIYLQVRKREYYRQRGT